MKAFLVFLSAMELIKLHCLSSFFFLLAGENLPLMPLSLAYIIALATDRILARKSRRVLSYFLVHAAVFAASFYLVLLFTQGARRSSGDCFSRLSQRTYLFISFREPWRFIGSGVSGS
jgi:hypothetical protein